MLKKQSHKNLQRASMLFLLLAVGSLTVFALLLLYRFDNKYTSQGPQAVGGVLLINERALENYPVLFLVNGWEFYNGRLLTPEDFTQGHPPVGEHIFIGQYGGFEAGNENASPHGSASYRLSIVLPEEVQTYMLELPEIYSAYRLYINGREMAGLGNPEPSAYRPETGNRFVSFEAQGRSEILVAVSDFSHIYSGMVYPPAFGRPEAVSRLLFARLLFRGVLCAAALTIGLIALLIGVLSRRNALTALYGLICLCFVCYTSYPITQTLLNGTHLLYAIENFSFCAMFVFVIQLQTKICGGNNRYSRPILLFGLLMCLASLLLPLLLPGGNLRMMTAYASLIAVYKWVTAFYVTISAARAAARDTVGSKPLLCGNLVFDCALVMDRLLPMHEPVITGWFLELAGFILVLSIGVVIGKEVAAQYAKSTAMEERARSMERLSQMQRTWYPLLQERIEEARTAQHDLRHHFAMIDGFVHNRQYERLETYVSEYGAMMRGREMDHYCQNDVANILAHHYARLAQIHGIGLTLALDIGRETMLADADLCSLLSNLLENAVEACLRRTEGKRFITLSAVQTNSSLFIHMENSADDAPSNALGFLSSKGRARKGYGLDSMRAIARRYGGTAEFTHDKAAGMFTSTVALRGLV